MKKLLAYLLVFCMVFSLLPVAAAAEEVASGTCGDNLTWSLDDEGQLTISGEGAMKDYTMPNYVPWYSHRSKIIRVWVQEGVTSLGDYAFYGLEKMFDITLPESLERIGDVALGGTALEYVYIPSGVIEIGGEVFGGCSQLNYISVSKENQAFCCDDAGVLFNKDKTQLIRCPQAFAGTYMIPETVELVGEKAFESCQLLTEVTVPGSVKELSRHAFASCTALEAVHLREGLEIIGNEVFMICSSLKGSLTIPASVTSLGNSVFDMTELTELRFVGDMPEFGEYAFAGISLTVSYPAGNETWTEEKIEAIKGLSTFVPYDTMEEVASGAWGDNIAWKLTVNGTLVISGEGEAEDAWDYEYPWYSYAEQIRKVIFEEGVTNVPEMAFNYYYPNLYSAEMKSVEVIGNSAFTQCYALTDVILPDTLKKIETGAFNYAGITAIEIPEGLTTLGSGVFGNTPLTEIVLSEGLSTMGSDVFFFCTDLKTVVLPDSLSSWDMLVFGQCTSLESINIPAGVENIRESMFTGCESLKSIEIPGNIKTIFSGAFSDAGLEEITFLGDAPQIYDSAFENIYATAYYPGDNETWTEDVMQDYGGTITWVAYSNSLPCDNGHHVPGLHFIDKETGYCAYCGIPCHSNGTTVWAIEEDGTMIIYGTGENGAGELDYYDFLWTDYLDEITSLIVEEGITGPIFGFQECENLKTISLSNGITRIDKYAFGYCPNLEQVNIPSSLQELGSGAFYGCGKLTEVYLPASLQYPGSGIFAACANLEGIWVDENNPYLYSDAYGVLYSIDGADLYAAPGRLSGHYTFPDTVTYIHDASFEGCTGLTGVTFSGDVDFISHFVFRGCTSLETVTFCGSVGELATYAFKDCTGLETITFQGDAPWMMDGCFEDVTATAYYPGGNDTWTEDVMQDYGGTITWVPVYDEAFSAAFKYATTSLGGTINLNIYVEMSDNLVNDADTFVRFVCAGKTTDVPMKDALASMDYGTLLYKFSLPLNAKQVSDTVTVQVMNGDEEVGSILEYSIMKYCVNRIAKSPDAAEVAACKALLNYAAAAQVYFGYNTDNLANASLSDEDKILPTADVAQYSSKVTGSETGIKAKEATLMAESVVTVRVYFTLSAGYSIDDFTFYVDGKEVAPKQNDKGDYYVETDGIAAKNMDEMHTFTVGGLTVEYGPLCYVKNKQAKSDDPVVINMVNAIYAYFKAAEAVLG